MSTYLNGHGMDISLRDYVDIFHRRRAIIIQTCVVVIAAGFVLNLITKPRYRSYTRIVLEGKSNTPQSAEADNPLADLFLQDSGHSIATQVGIIQGELVLKSTCDAAGVKPGTFDTTVVPQTGTDLVDITVESENRDTATKIATQLPITYDDFTRTNQTKEIDNALKSAKKQFDLAKLDLTIVRAKLKDMRARSNIFNVDEYLKGMSEAAANTNASRQGAEATVQQDEAQLDVLRQQRSKLAPYLEVSSQVTNPDIALINDQIATHMTERSQALILFTPDSPKVLAIDAAISDLKTRLARAPAMVTTVVKHPNEEITDYDHRIKEATMELAGAQAGLSAATSSTADTTSSLLADADKEMDQEEKEEEVDRIKAQTILLTKSMSDLQLKRAAVRDVVTHVTDAHHAVKVSPKQTQNLVFAAVLGLVLGVCFALLQEYLDDRVNSPEHVKGIIGAPTLGFIPLVKQESDMLISGGTASSLMESYRALRSNVGFATVDSEKNAILITSTRPGEGKSTTAVNLATSMALDDKRVILVDLDLRRPTVHQKLNLDPSIGVTNVLMGHKSLEDALQPTSVERLQVLTSGPLPPNPAELMSSHAMRKLLDELKELADVVIIDSPPLLATADSQVLSALVDGVVFVIQFGVVRKPEIRHAYSLLQQASINMLGVVFNKIDVSANKEYEYGVYQHYSHYSDKDVNDAETSPISSNAFQKMIEQIDQNRSGLPAKPTEVAPPKRPKNGKPQ